MSKGSSGGGAAPASAKGPAVPRSQEEFVNTVKDIVKNAPKADIFLKTRGFPDKVYISHVREQMQKQFPGLTHQEIDNRLLQANRDRTLMLSRVDMVSVGNFDKIQSSEISTLGGIATFHFVSLRR